MLLALRTWPEKSQREIAAQVGCAQSFVAKVKSQFITSDKPDAPTTVTGRDGKQYPTSKPRQPKPEQTADEATMRVGELLPHAEHFADCGRRTDWANWRRFGSTGGCLDFHAG